MPSNGARDRAPMRRAARPIAADAPHGTGHTTVAPPNLK